MDADYDESHLPPLRPGFVRRSVEVRVDQIFDGTGVVGTIHRITVDDRKVGPRPGTDDPDEPTIVEK